MADAKLKRREDVKKVRELCDTPDSLVKGAISA